jgi:hypothetical protein
MLAVGLALLCSASARAGTYEVWSCAGPDGKPVPADGWRSEGYGYFSSPSNDCAGGNGLFAGLNGDFDHGANTEILTWHYQVPAPLKIASYRLWRAVRTGPNSTNASSVYWMSRQANQYTGAYVVTPENCPGCGAMGDLNAHFVNANLVSESGLADVRDLFLNAGCGGVTGWNCRADASADPYMVYFRMYRAAVVLQDDSDPVFTSPPAGSLTAGGVLAGTHGVSFSATDTGSGVYRAIIEVDGKQAVTQLLGCAEPFIAIAPCKPAASGTVSLDTTTLADGPHTVRVVVTDATYANTAAFGPFTITTSNAPTSCAPAESPDLSVRFDRRRSTISYGGRLNVIGQAPPAAQVRVFSQISRAGAPAKLGRTPLTADAQGSFTYKVPAGPSRSLRFAYRGAADPLYQCSKPLNVNVRARVTLKASPRSIRSGSRVRFTGKLRGGYVPSNGKLVELQAHERGRWRSIRTVRTNAKGAFSYRYRFSFRAGGTTFPVRARVRPDGSYPFALGTSRRITVRVR